jgi:hypothetical protein
MTLTIVNDFLKNNSRSTETRAKKMLRAIALNS